MVMGSSSRRWVNQSTRSRVAYSTASNASKRPAPVKQLGRVNAIDCLRQGVVLAVGDTTDRRLDAHFSNAFGLADEDMLVAAIGVMDETAATLPSER